MSNKEGVSHSPNPVLAHTGSRVFIKLDIVRSQRAAQTAMVEPIGIEPMT
jgi:hypothetical protein